MNLTFFAIVIMSAWVIAIAIAGLVLALRPGGLGVRFQPVGEPGSSTGPIGEIPLGGPAETLGNPRGRVRAVLVDPQTRRLLAIRLAAGLEDEDVPASAILDADGQGVHLTEAWSETPPDSLDTKAALLRDGMPVATADHKRLGRLRFVCFDPWSQAVTSIVAGSSTGFRLVPFDRVTEAGPDAIATSLEAVDVIRLPEFATDWDIRQAILSAVSSDPTLRTVQRSLDVEVVDQRVRARGYADDRAQASKVEQVMRAVPGVRQLDLQLVSDDGLAVAVTDAIKRDIPAAQVRVTARSGIVDIAGETPDRATARRIDAAARQVPGVQAVRNMVAIRPTTATAS